ETVICAILQPLISERLGGRALVEAERGSVGISAITPVKLLLGMTGNT
ncbi:hypothetical protein ABIA20_000001, partial [Sinorhizobium fredii]